MPIVKTKATQYQLDEPLDSLIDETNPDCVYIGWTDTIGGSTGAKIWRIKRIIKSGSITSIGFASSTTDFNQVWNNRASLTYSQGG